MQNIYSVLYRRQRKQRSMPQIRTNIVEGGLLQHRCYCGKLQAIAERNDQWLYWHYRDVQKFVKLGPAGLRCPSQCPIQKEELFSPPYFFSWLYYRNMGEVYKHIMSTGSEIFQNEKRLMLWIIFITVIIRIWRMNHKSIRFFFPL